MKSRLILLAVVALLLGLSLVGCGPKNNGATQPPATTSAPAVPSRTTPIAAIAGLSWDDVPIYRGLSQVQQASYSVPPAQGNYAKFEWRYYESRDSVPNIAAFYKQEMPARGWTEAGWVEVPQMNYGVYNKNGEKDAAMVMVSDQGGKTVVALWRATQQ